jgi:small subunit ribosomal protein S9
MREGTGQIMINNRHWMYYFKDVCWRHHLISPLLATEMTNKFDIRVSVRGGGLSGSYSVIRTHTQFNFV